MHLRVQSGPAVPGGAVGGRGSTCGCCRGHELPREAEPAPEKAREAAVGSGEGRGSTNKAGKGSNKIEEGLGETLG